MSTPGISDRAMAHRVPSYRAFDLLSVECRDSASGDGFTFEGVASVVDMPYEVHDQFGTFTETIRSGAFSKSLKDSKADVALYVNHRHADVPMASTRAKTMTLTADPHLRALASLDSARSDVVIARSAVMRGELPQMSIGFTVNKASDDWNADYTERIIREVNLMEVSIVRQGANPHTTASIRSLDDLFEAIETGDMPEADVMRAFHALAVRVRTTMPDLADTPTGVAAALDAIIDEIIDSLAEGDLEAAIALATAADITADSLLALLGMPENEATEEPPDPMRSANPFAERDWADRDRLERLCLLR